METGGAKAKKPKRARAPKGSAEKTRYTVQFDVSPEDDADLMELVGPLRNRSTVALMLFLYGLDNSSDAFAHYARHHQAARLKRLAARLAAAEAARAAEPTTG